VKRLELSNGGLTDRASNFVDFSGLSALEFLDLAGNKFSSLPFGIVFLPKLGFLCVEACKYLVSIPDLPSSLDFLAAAYCKSLKRVRIPIEPKKELFIELCGSHLLEEIQGIESLSNSFWSIYVDDKRALAQKSNNHSPNNHSPSKLQKSVVEILFLSVSRSQEETHTIGTYIG